MASVYVGEVILSSNCRGGGGCLFVCLFFIFFFFCFKILAYRQKSNILYAPYLGCMRAASTWRLWVSGLVGHFVQTCSVQYLDCSDLNWRCNHYHLFWHCVTLWCWCAVKLWYHHHHLYAPLDRDYDTFHEAWLKSDEYCARSMVLLKFEHRKFCKVHCMT